MNINTHPPAVSLVADFDELVKVTSWPNPILAATQVRIRVEWDATNGAELSGYATGFRYKDNGEVGKRTATVRLYDRGALPADVAQAIIQAAEDQLNATAKLTGSSETIR